MDKTIKHTFKKAERLSLKDEIETLFNEGRSMFIYPFKFVYQLYPLNEEEAYPVKLLVTVSKRNFRRAVKRNLIKRRIREIYRVKKSVLHEKLYTEKLLAHVGIIYSATEILSYKEMEKKYKIAQLKLIEHIKHSSKIK